MRRKMWKRFCIHLGGFKINFAGEQNQARPCKQGKLDIFWV